jgi:hypothetical protein
MSNIRNIFEIKENEIRSLEIKYSKLEEENINLRKRLSELEQQNVKTSSQSFYKSIDKSYETNRMLNSFHKDKLLKTKPKNYNTYSMDSDYIGFNSENQIIRENHYLYSPDSNSKNDGDGNRGEIKDFLIHVKSKLQPDAFKEFIKYLKILTSTNTNVYKTNFMKEVGKLFIGNSDLYEKFEQIIINKK